MLLLHLLALAGIDSVAIEARNRPEVDTADRACILERDSVRMLVDSGVSDRVLTEGHERQGIDLPITPRGPWNACGRPSTSRTG